MENKGKITFQFLSEPSDINYGGKVHGGVVMKWIDQTAYTCARTWTERYCVTVYVGGIRFYSPINIGDIVKIDAYVIHTGSTSIHIGIDVFAKDIASDTFQKKTHCIIVFVALDEAGKPTQVRKWIPGNDAELKLEQYAIKLKELRANIEKEMQPFLSSE